MREVFNRLRRWRYARTHRPYDWATELPNLVPLAYVRIVSRYPRGHEV